MTVIDPPPDEVVACCSTLYSHPLAELLIGESFHPGGLRSTRQLLDAARLPGRAALLDIGCGLGASARVAAAEFGLRVDAVDASASIIERARDRSSSVRGDITWHEADLRRLPFADDSFDAVLAECVLSTSPREKALAEISRVLRPGGLLLLSDVQSSGRAIEGLDDHALLGAALCVSGAWTPGELERALPPHDLRLRRQWDRSEDVLRLIERIEGRLAIAASVAPTLNLPIAFEGKLDVLDTENAGALASAAREAVDAGDLGYFAALVRPA